MTIGTKRTIQRRNRDLEKEERRFFCEFEYTGEKCITEK